MTRVALAVFDVGGTSIRDTADVPAVFASALSQHGIATTPALLRQWRGASKKEVIARLIEESALQSLDPERVYRTFQDLLVAALGERGVEAVPGIEDAFDRLRSSGCKVCLATGFDTRIMGVVMDALRWSQVVDGVVTADDVSRGRPAPDLIHTAMLKANVERAASVVAVGDTTNDLESARAAGVGASIGVLTGAHDRERLSAAPHTVILESAADIPSWLSERQWLIG